MSPNPSAKPRDGGGAAPSHRSASRLPDVVALGGLALLGVALLREAATAVSDPDLFWHVLLGHRLAETWVFAGPDPLAGSAGDYVYNQWLPELLYAAAEQAGGLAGVVWVIHVTRVVWLLAMYAACRAFAPPVLSAVIVGISLVAAGGSLSPRPQVLGLAFLAVTTMAWLRSADDGRPRWWLVALTWVWAGTHGSWAVGLAVAAAALAGRVLDGHRDRSQLLRLAGVLAASALATVLTPVGPRLLGVFRAVNEISPYISEWRPLSIGSAQLAAVVVVFFAVVLAWLARLGSAAASARSGRADGAGAGAAAGAGAGAAATVHWADRLLALGALTLALSAARSVAIAAVVLAPVAARALAPWLPGAARIRHERWVVAAIAAVLLVVPAAFLPGAAVANPERIPTRLSAQLAALPVGTVVFNADTLGGWLMWAFPQVRVHYDTRAEAYGAAYVQRYTSARALRPGWERTVADSGARLALLEDESPLTAALVSQLGWTVVGSDAGFRLLRAPTAG